MRVVCKYCDRQAVLRMGCEVYHGRPDLARKLFWVCTPCGARVGCHPGTDKPLGDLADANLRDARAAAHRALDRVWGDGSMTRGQAYRWLAGAIKVKPSRCHIGQFDESQCSAVVKAVRELLA